MTSTNTPRFAVVGHPNKGKSSIVAALAQNDAIDISSRSGTTLRADPFAIAIGDAAYTLIDTPGFQRPRRALEWLNRHATSADQLRHCSSFRKRVAITGPSLQILLILENQIGIAN